MAATFAFDRDHGTATGGPYYFQPSTWSNAYAFTMKQGTTLTLFVKASAATPTLYITSIDASVE